MSRRCCKRGRGSQTQTHLNPELFFLCTLLFLNLIPTNKAHLSDPNSRSHSQFVHQKVTVNIQRLNFKDQISVFNKWPENIFSVSVNFKSVDTEQIQQNHNVVDSEHRGQSGSCCRVTRASAAGNTRPAPPSPPAEALRRQRPTAGQSPWQHVSNHSPQTIVCAENLLTVAEKVRGHIYSSCATAGVYKRATWPTLLS